MLQAIVHHVTFAFKNEFAIFTIDLKFQAIVVVVLSDITIVSETLRAISAEVMCELVSVIAIEVNHLFAFLALYFQLLE